VEDQGQLGSCTANATVGALEYLYTKRDGRSVDLSRLFVYYNSRRIRGTIMQDTGAYICDAMASVLSFGACREEIWPYDVSTFMMEPSQQAYQEPLMHEAIQYSRVEAVEGSISALAAGFPIVFGTRIPERCYQEAATKGTMPIPSDAEIMSFQGGGHCMLIVGYDKPGKMFIVRNSWGTNWGARGYVQIPFDLIFKCSPPDGFWIIGELAKPGNYSVIRPGKPEFANRPMAGPGAAKSSSIADKAAKMRGEIRASLDAEIDASNRRIEKILSGTTGGQKSPRGPLGASVTCPLCSGSGKGRNGGDCTQCGGVGFIAVPDRPKGWATCPLCGGSGKSNDGNACRQCGGSGFISTYDRLRSGAGKFRETVGCPACDGNGVCPKCSGQGLACESCQGSHQCQVCGGTGTVGN